MNPLAQELVTLGHIRSPRVTEAFKHIDRADFVPESMKVYAYLNEPLAIGYGQTISQPSTVAFLLELLEPKEGEKILDIGAGTGWQTALLAHCVTHDEYGYRLHRDRSHNGRVYGVEVVPELFRLGVKNFGKYGFMNTGAVSIYCMNARKGLPDYAPFDKIISAAAGEEIPPAWREQLSVGGKIVAPLARGSVVVIDKKSHTRFEEREYKGFVFVPLV